MIHFVALLILRLLIAEYKDIITCPSCLQLGLFILFVPVGRNFAALFPLIA